MTNFDKILTPVVSFTPDTSAYSAGDSIGGSLSFDLTGSASGGGLLNYIKVIDDDNEGAAGALWLFKAALTTPIADNAAFAWVKADWANWIGMWTLPSFGALSSMKYALLEDLNTLFKVDANLIKGYYVTSGTPTYAPSKTIRIELGILTQ